ncbi:hypothetical protein HSX10_17700 [Winogradskyella undariae]|uniref:hypothetical protein n=1 Tax=Winogradskyella TaxID=286104 RepID=UPI00156A911C|nr:MULTISPECIES: hypothetical protein [Winogradskyella]NRR93412.1 hypothetical protein [Winogradskyella undariae]QXP79395.1 hypothetical protein H0I32_01765 [Winogradskyella sp. HaHa_3_26]
MLQFEIEDHDDDGVPSYLEDLDNDLDVTDHNTDDNGFPDFVDADDDGVATIDEVLQNTYTVDTNIGEEEPTLTDNEYISAKSKLEGVITIKTVILVDSNNDGTPDYLDPEY